MELLTRRRVAHRHVTPPPSPRLRELVAGMRYELVPMKGVEVAVAALPERAPVSITCSPTKGFAPTQELASHLVEHGHDVVPHIGARVVEDPGHVARIASWIRTIGIAEIFVIAGDGARPAGPYADTYSFVRALLEHESGLERIGLAAYPDGHAFLSAATLRETLETKRDLIAAAGIAASVTTQLCFDQALVTEWLRASRAEGFDLPVHLGLPGVVDRTRLMKMGVRLGIGSSLRYLAKNRVSVGRMLGPGGYDPTELATSLAGDAELGLAGLHAYTFNSVADTAAWQRAVVASTPA